MKFLIAITLLFSGLAHSSLDLVFQGIEEEKIGLFLKNYRSHMNHQSMTKHVSFASYQRKTFDVYKLKMTPFLYAAYYGDIVAMKVMLENGANLNQADNEGHNALHFAVMDSKCYRTSNEGFCLDTVKFLTKLGLKSSRRKNIRSTPLVEAYLRGYYGLSQYLQKYENQINDANKDGKTLLHFLAQRGDLKGLKWAIGEGGDISQEDNYGRKPIFYAEWNGHREVIQFLKDYQSEIFDAKENQKKNALKNSVLWSDFNKFDRLLKKNVKNLDLNSNLDEEGSSALMLACLKGNLAILERLLQFPAIDVNKQNNYGRTALRFAVDCKNCSEEKTLSMVKLLLKSGALPNLASSNGWTPLMKAVQNGHSDVVDLLISSGAAVNLAATPGGETALILAVKFNRSEIIKKLLQANPNLNQKDSKKKTALHYAINQKNTTAIKLLGGSQSDIQDIVNKQDPHSITLYNMPLKYYPKAGPHRKTFFSFLAFAPNLFLKMADLSLGTIVWNTLPQKKIIIKEVLKNKTVSQFLSYQEINEVVARILKENKNPLSPLTSNKSIYLKLTNALLIKILNKIISQNTPANYPNKLIKKITDRNISRFSFCIKNAAKNKNLEDRIHQKNFHKHFNQCTKNLTHNLPLTLGWDLIQVHLWTSLRPYYTRNSEQYSKIRKKTLDTYSQCIKRNYAKLVGNDDFQTVRACVLSSFAAAVKVAVPQQADKELKRFIDDPIKRYVAKGLILKKINKQFPKGIRSYRRLSPEGLKQDIQNLINGITTSLSEMVIYHLAEKHEIFQQLVPKKKQERFIKNIVNKSLRPCLDNQIIKNPMNCKKYIELYAGYLIGGEELRKVTLKSTTSLGLSDTSVKRIESIAVSRWKSCYQDEKEKIKQSYEYGIQLPKNYDGTLTCFKKIIPLIASKTTEIFAMEKIKNPSIKQLGLNISQDEIKEYALGFFKCTYKELVPLTTVAALSSRSKRLIDKCKFKLLSKVLLEKGPAIVRKELPKHFPMNARAWEKVEFLISRIQKELPNIETEPHFLESISSFAFKLLDLGFKINLETQLAKTLPPNGTYAEENKTLLSKTIRHFSRQSILERFKGFLLMGKIKRFEMWLDAHVALYLAKPLAKREFSEHFKNESSIALAAEIAYQKLYQCLGMKKNGNLNLQSRKGNAEDCLKKIEGPVFKEVAKIIYKNKVKPQFASSSPSLEPAFRIQFFKTINDCLANGFPVSVCAKRVNLFAGREIPKLVLTDQLQRQFPGNKEEANQIFEESYTNTYLACLSRAKSIDTCANKLVSKASYLVSTAKFKESIHSQLGAKSKITLRLLGATNRELKSCINQIPLSLPGKDFTRKTEDCIGHQIIQIAQTVVKNVLPNYKELFSKLDYLKAQQKSAACLAQIRKDMGPEIIQKSVEDCASQLQTYVETAIVKILLRNYKYRALPHAKPLMSNSVTLGITALDLLVPKDPNKGPEKIDGQVARKYIKLIAQFYEYSHEYDSSLAPRIVKKLMVEAQKGKETGNIHYLTNQLTNQSSFNDLFSLLLSRILNEELLKGTKKNKVSDLEKAMKMSSSIMPAKKLIALLIKRNPIYNQQIDVLTQYSENEGRDKIEEIVRRNDSMMRAVHRGTRKLHIDKMLATSPGKRLKGEVYKFLVEVISRWTLDQSPLDKRIKKISKRLKEFECKEGPILRNLLARAVTSPTYHGSLVEDYFGSATQSGLTYNRLNSQAATSAIFYGRVTGLDEEDFNWKNLRNRPSGKLAIYHFADRILYPMIAGIKVSKKEQKRRLAKIEELVKAAVKE